MSYPKALQDLIDSFRRLPGVGEKTAERYAFQMLDLDKEDVNNFAQALVNIKEKITTCSICGNISEHEHCSICDNINRDKSVICVVQNAKDVIAMERVQQYNGVYHVLNGVISTSKGILPEDININTLIDRVDSGAVEEVIVATNLTVEGETTALYIAKILENKNVKVTRIAHGLPMGGHLDYADELTLSKAMEGRKIMR